MCQQLTRLFTDPEDSEINILLFLTVLTKYIYRAVTAINNIFFKIQRRYKITLMKISQLPNNNTSNLLFIQV